MRVDLNEKGSRIRPEVWIVVAKGAHGVGRTEADAVQDFEACVRDDVISQAGQLLLGSVGIHGGREDTHYLCFTQARHEQPLIIDIWLVINQWGVYGVGSTRQFARDDYFSEATNLEEDISRTVRLVVTVPAPEALFMTAPVPDGDGGQRSLAA
jgi:hypothetical protein